MIYNINNSFCDEKEAKYIIDFCLTNGEPFSYNPTEYWDCRRIYNDDFRGTMIDRLINFYKNENSKLWFDFADFKLKNFSISLTAYYDGRYLNLHKDKSSELTSVIVLSNDFIGGDFALTEDKIPSYHFENMDNISTFKLKLGDVITFNGSETYHGVLPVTEGKRYALNIWMTETDFKYPKNKTSETLL
jgi:Rps23 Pro-64 3,4-dihydroxylase Tpa1-like proline 4-hydroxylase